jgi:hypothetical protein
VADQIIAVEQACECDTANAIQPIPDPCRPRLATYLDAIARTLRDCLCDKLLETVAGAVCRCSLMSGDAPIADICDIQPGGEGQAWVRLTRLFMSREFPRPISDVFNCAAGFWAAEFELGVLRCAVGPDEDGTPPTADELNCEAAKVLDDAFALRFTAECCLPSSISVVPGEWQPLASGGCVGGKVTVTVQLIPGPISIV